MKNKRGIVLIAVGIFCILAAIALTLRNFWLTRQAGASASEILTQLTAQIHEEGQSKVIQPATSLPVLGSSLEIPDYVLDPNMQMPVVNIDGRDYIGELSLPSLGLTLPIGADWDMASLNDTPCRYYGSVYSSDLVIAGHNYETHFGNLYRLSVDDSVIITDVDGNVFTYQVASIDTLDATAVEEAVVTDFDLTLFTCTVGGKFRICIRCTLVDQQSNQLSDQS